MRGWIHGYDWVRLQNDAQHNCSTCVASFAAVAKFLLRQNGTGWHADLGLAGVDRLVGQPAG